MPQTSDAYFLNVDQSGGVKPWTDLTNILAAAGEATATNLSSGASTDTVELTNPANASEMGPNDEITDIRIQVRAYYEDGDGEVRLDQLVIGSGSAKSAVMVENTPTTYIFDGDLAYWGITKQQARNFVDGTTSLDFRVRNIGGTFQTTKEALVWVEVRFDYIESTLVNLPTLF